MNLHVEILRAMDRELHGRKRAIFAAALAESMALQAAAVDGACKALARRGLVKRPGVRGLKPSTRAWCITPLGRDAARRGIASRPPTAAKLQLAAWCAMRMQRKFSANSLLAVICDAENDADAMRLARRAIVGYLRALARARVIARLPRSHEGQRFALIEDLGPWAPGATREGDVYDHNRRAWLAGDAR